MGPVRNPVLGTREEPGNTGWRPVFPGSSRLGIEPKSGEYRSQTGIQRKLNFVSVRTIKERSSHASEVQSHCPGFCSWYGDECLGEQADNNKASELYWKPLSWLGTLSPTTANDAWDQPLWETLVCTTLGLEVPVLASLPRRNQRAPALCGCKKHGMDLFGDHTSTCTAHSGALWRNQCTRLGRRSSGPSLPVSWTHSPVSAPGDGQRRPTAWLRGNQELSPGRCRTQQPGL